MELTVRDLLEEALFNDADEWVCVNSGCSNEAVIRAVLGPHCDKDVVYCTPHRQVIQDWLDIGNIDFVCDLPTGCGKTMYFIRWEPLR